MLLVEFDPDSQWFSIATTLAANTFRDDRFVGYLAMARPVDDVKQSFSDIGIGVNQPRSPERLVVEDWYSATRSGGRLDPQGGEVFERTSDGLRVRSLRVADLSVDWLKSSKSGPRVYDIVDFWPPGSLIVVESFSSILRFNEEKPFIEWLESRVNPEERKRKSITLQGVVRGIHTDWLYKRMESACDGVVDIRVMERADEARTFLRIRSLKGQPHDARWHEVMIKSTGEAAFAA
jgi:KaiC/GvpD/RAD55 family RecA-like ATPase